MNPGLRFISSSVVVTSTAPIDTSSIISGNAVHLEFLDLRFTHECHCTFVHAILQLVHRGDLVHHNKHGIAICR